MKKYKINKKYIKNRNLKKHKHNIKRKNKKYVRGKKIPLNSFNRKVPYEIDLWNSIKIEKRNETFVFPKIFSLTSNPKETLYFIKKIASCYRKKQDLDIKLDCKNTIEFDISSLIILSSIIVKGSKYIHGFGYKHKISGNFPYEEKCKEIFINSGLPKHLNIFKNDEINNIELLEPFSTIKHTTKETMRIINYYNSCLRRNGLMLNDKGKDYFFDLINEIVDNAIIHGQHGKTVYSGGYYNQREHKGQLSIISYGNSMYESLNSKDTSIEVKDTIEHFSKMHNKYFDDNYDEESLWTLLAIQYKISRLKNKTNDRGTGTIKFIETFMKMGNTLGTEKPVMSITSGNTTIVFDGKYKIEEKDYKGSLVKQIAFNKENNLEKCPDKCYVKNNNVKFPGVAINIEFYIDKEYLKQYKEEN